MKKMKKLNRKGFTLIELLAVVVIMGIILVVTIPSVLNTTKTAKEKQLKNAANTVADWYNKQYQMSLLDMEGVVDENYTNFHPYTGSSIYEARPFKSKLSNPTPSNEQRKAALEAAGVSDVEANFSLEESYIILFNNKVCVRLKAKEGGSFYTSGGNNRKCSSTCILGLNGVEANASSGIKCEENDLK